MYERIARSYVDLLQRARGWDYRPMLETLERLDAAPPEAIEEYRRTRLRELLEHCGRNVPFWRREFARIGFDPTRLRDVSDLAPLPIVNKRVLRASYGDFLDERGAGAWDDWVTSGATGEPFAFRLDRQSIAANTFAALARGRRWWGFDYGEREAMIWSGVRDVTGALQGSIVALRRRVSWRIKNIVLIDIYSLGDEAIARAYRRLLRFQPRLIRAISSGLFRFCEGLERQGLDGTRLGVRGAIFTGEGMTPVQRRLIERVLGCPTICEYGCCELGVIAFECPSRGLHLAHENMVFEFLRDGRPALPGETASLLVTNLNSLVSPLVRYELGDLVVPSAKRCDCGRPSPLLESVSGRAHDTIRSPGGSVIHALFFTHLFDELPQVHQFRVVQTRIDRLRVELRSDRTIEVSVRERLERSVRSAMGEGVEIEVVQVDALPVSPNGKTPWIVSEIQA
ncbi:MAG: phenylacetate--CoA ligase family protein [Deltaproteobacteria bacterium]|nr:phenylacetate--CoA ligase family protein [Deltaproteobacteria bacterium]